ncbi:hypothetical protein Hanom_Chr10g00959811 [Helianthus anomalus]
MHFLPVAYGKHFLMLIHHYMIQRTVTLSCFLIMNNRMPVAERTSFNILTT